ncbi:MAG: HypC/HybG/HupF family hydrogenase formation chaperone [Promethearchaeota archaeon]
MCIAVPVQLLEIDNDHAIVDYGGLRKKVSIALVKNRVSVGDYVIVHAGCAIERLDPQEAMETIEMMKEFLD